MGLTNSDNRERAWKASPQTEPLSNSEIDADGRKNQLPEREGVRCQHAQPTQRCELPWYLEFKGKNKWSYKLQWEERKELVRSNFGMRKSSFLFAVNTATY